MTDAASTREGTWLDGTSTCCTAIAAAVAGGADGATGVVEPLAGAGWSEAVERGVAAPGKGLTTPEEGAPEATGMRMSSGESGIMSSDTPGMWMRFASLLYDAGMICELK